MTRGQAEKSLIVAFSRYPPSLNLRSKCSYYHVVILPGAHQGIRPGSMDEVRFMFNGDV